MQPLDCRLSVAGDNGDGQPLAARPGRRGYLNVTESLQPQGIAPRRCFDILGRDANISGTGNFGCGLGERPAVLDRRKAVGTIFIGDDQRAQASDGVGI